MKLSRSLILVAITAVFSVFMLHAGTPPPPPFQPTIETVDKDGITVITKKVPHVTSKKYQVTKSTTIIVNGLPGTLDDLKPNMVVQVTNGMDRDVLDKIVANNVADPLPAPAPGANFQGSSVGTRVLAVTTDKITIASPGNKATAYLIGPHAIIKVNGSVSPLTDIKVGMSVTVNSDGHTATRIVAQDSH